MKEIKSFINVYYKLNKILTHRQKIDSIWIFFTIIVSSCLELIGVSIIVPFLELITNIEDLKGRRYISWIYDIYPSLSDGGLLLLLSLLFVVVYVVKNGFMLYSTYVQTKYAAAFYKDNSIRMLEAYLKRPYEFFTNTNSSIILRGINGDVYGTYHVLEDSIGMVNDMLNILMIGVFLLVTDWVIAISALLLASSCMLITIVSFKGKMKKAGNINREAAAVKTNCSYQAIVGIKEITVMNRRDLFTDAYRKAADDEKKISIIKNVINACPDRIIEAICISGFMLVVCFRMMTGNNMGAFITTVGAFAMGAFRILPSFSKISSKINRIVFEIPCVLNCYDNLEKANKFDLDSKKVENNKDNDSKSDKKLSFIESLRLKKVNWKYANSKDYVLKNLDLEIKKGASVAFIGPSGAGKTTLADIILGLFTPQSGTVESDGVNIYSQRDIWAQIIGYVPQTVFLIDDTIKNNIAFGIPKEQIDEDKVWSALEKAQLKAFVQKLPDGLDTVVGERGVKFSGGQRQRIAIARALYEDPEILVLDEATSALDNETESAVMDAIDSLHGKKTLIIIAHRLSTIENCDEIYEINNGVATRVNL